MGHCESARKNSSGRPINVDLRDDRHDCAVALRIGDAPAADRITGLVTTWRRTSDPTGFLRRRLDYGDVTGVFDMTQPKLDRVNVESCRNLVDERFASEMDLRTHWIAQVRAPERRTAVQER